MSAFDPLLLMYDDATGSTIQGVPVSNPLSVTIIARLNKLHKQDVPKCNYCGVSNTQLKINIVDGDPTNVLNTNLEFLCAKCNTERFENSVVCVEVLKVDLDSGDYVEAFIKKAVDKSTGLLVSQSDITSITNVIKRSYQGLPPSYATLIKLWLELSDVALVKGLTRIDYVSNGKRSMLQDMALLALMLAQIEKKRQTSLIKPATAVPPNLPGLVPGR